MIKHFDNYCFDIIYVFNALAVEVGNMAQKYIIKVFLGISAKIMLNNFYFEIRENTCLIGQNEPWFFLPSVKIYFLFLCS